MPLCPLTELNILIKSPSRTDFIVSLSYLGFLKYREIGSWLQIKSRKNISKISREFKTKRTKISIISTCARTSRVLFDNILLPRFFMLPSLRPLYVNYFFYFLKTRTVINRCRKAETRKLTWMGWATLDVGQSERLSSVIEEDYLKALGNHHAYCS